MSAACDRTTESLSESRQMPVDRRANTVVGLGAKGTLTLDPVK